MTEHEYLIATDLVRVRAARDLLRSNSPDALENLDDLYQIAHLALSQIELTLQREVQDFLQEDEA